MTPQELANQFMTAYGDNSQHVYSVVKNECMSLFTNAKSYSVKACDWMDKSSDEMEMWIIVNVVPELIVNNFPLPHTKVLNDVVWNACYKEWK